MVENPGLSYGLFHAVAQPVYSWGVVRQVEFHGVNIDIGLMRNLAWSRRYEKAECMAYHRMRAVHERAGAHGANCTRARRGFMLLHFFKNRSCRKLIVFLCLIFWIIAIPYTWIHWDQMGLVLKVFLVISEIIFIPDIKFFKSIIFDK